MERLEKAKEILMDEELNFVLISDRGTIKSNDNGIFPIYTNYLQNSEYFLGASVADRVIGNAAAILLVDAGIKELYTVLVGLNAIKILEDAGVDLYCKEVSENILNKDRTGLCPMENLSTDIPPASVLIERIGEFFDQ